MDAEPTKMPPEAEIQLYHSVGRLMNRWGYIDSLFSQLCHDLVGLSHKPKRGVAPWALMDRLKFVLDCFETDLRLKNGIDAVKVIIDDVRQVDLHRGFLVHGCMTNYTPEGQIFHFTKFDRTPDRKGYQQFSSLISLSDLHQLSDAATDLMRGLSTVAKLVQVAQKLGPNWGRP